MNLLLVATLLLAPGAGERDNRKGVEAWRRQDTAESVRRFQAAAAADTALTDYAFNLATAKAKANQDAEADFARALARSTSREERARTLFNRGTSRLHKALASPPGQGDVPGAITDLREALKLRPTWQEASRNLDRALRLRPPPRPKQDPKNDDKPEKKPDPKKSDSKPSPDEPPKPRDSESPSAAEMDPRDAQRLLDGAAAREAQQAQERKRKNNEVNDGPDW